MLLAYYYGNQKSAYKICNIIMRTNSHLYHATLLSIYPDGILTIKITQHNNLMTSNKTASKITTDLRRKSCFIFPPLKLPITIPLYHSLKHTAHMLIKQLQTIRHSDRLKDNTIVNYS